MQKNPPTAARLSPNHERNSSALRPMPDALSLEARYDHTWKHYHQIIDWRYKLMTRLFATWGALCMASGWMWMNHLQDALLLISLIGIASSYAAWVMERRTVVIISGCEREGARLETDSGRPGLFVRQASIESKQIPYDRILPRLYFCGLLTWVATALVFLIMLCR